jgi:hypothetical protein
MSQRRKDMRKLLIAAAAGASVLGGAVVAQSVQAQPYYVAPAPVYTAPAGYRYDAYGRLVYEPAYAAPVVGGAVIGPRVAEALGAVPFDQYGPDPNGMVSADGHRIKCKLQDDWDGRFDRYMTHRVCW